MAVDELYLKAINISLSYPVDNRAGKQNSGLWRKILGANHKVPEPDSRPTIKNINLDLRSGDRLGLVGSNGAGKTTLLKVLSGGIPIQKGQIKTNGKIVSLLNRTQGMSMEASGFENIILRGLYLGFSAAQMRKKADRIIEFSELGDHVYKPLRLYSAGMRARLSFSILMSSEPEIILLDEWLGAGDQEFQMKAANEMQKFVKSASIVVFATHRRRLQSLICNRIATMEEGRITSIV